MNASNIVAKDFFGALGNDTRLRCLMLLLREGELCVCELTHAIGASQPHVSRHLAQLREQGIVSDRREGLWVFYRINPSLPDWAYGVLRATASGMRNRAPFIDDEQALARMSNRPQSVRCA
jgi:ArsR family transcriptional regulator